MGLDITTTEHAIDNDHPQQPRANDTIAQNGNASPKVAIFSLLSPTG
jgi:hypothetical protein